MKFIWILMTVFLTVGCSEHVATPKRYDAVGVAVAPTSLKGNTVANAGPVNGISGGANLTGVVVPPGPVLIGRIQNGLEDSVRSTRGNFGRSVTQVSPNLPKATDVNNASGFDQVQLLAYAACSDLTTGSPSLMQSRYNVVAANTVAQNQSALVAAGLRMLDQHTAGLASRGPAAAQVTSVLTNLVQSQSANTSTMAFMTVCIAANTAGASMLGQ